MENFFVNLNRLDLLAVKGEDSGKLLQGQTTCDIDSISVNHSSLGAFCNNKGRVVSGFQILEIDDTYYLQMQNGLYLPTMQHLSKYSVFYKATIEDARADYFRAGISGSDTELFLSKFFTELPKVSNQLVNKDGNYLRLLASHSAIHSQRFELWICPEYSNAILTALEREFPESEYSSWELLDIQTGVYNFAPEDSGLYTPELLNYDLSGAVSFTKGCYTGQEIVARMHYRGSAKKRLFHIKIESSTALDEMQSLEIISKNDTKNQGKIIKLLKNKENIYEAWAILNSDALLIENSLTLEKIENSIVSLVPIIYAESA